MRSSGMLKKEDSGALNRMIIYFFIPIISLYHIPKLEFRSELLLLSIVPFVIFLGALLFFWLLGKALKLDTKTRQALQLTSGIGSTSFVGFPIFDLLFGSQGLAYAVLMSFGGTILVFNTLGLGLLMKFTSGKISTIQLLKKILLFVPFSAFVIALMINTSGIVYTDWLNTLLEKLASPFTVIALFTIGLQIEMSQFNKELFPLCLGLSFKLLIAPVLCYILIWHVFEMRSLISKICILGACIGPMNTIAILSAEKNLKPQLSLLMPAIGIPLSIPMLFLFNHILEQ